LRATSLLAPTLREIPSEAEVISHQLLLRAGMIRKTAAGVYSYLPLAWRVLIKISQIVREEMNMVGGQELMLPIIQPAEIWQSSGRWDVYGDEMFRLKDRHHRSFCLGPTHEEIITLQVKQEVKSYKQLPLLLYQIQNKYRDERRPRFGLMRGREFIMKDLYSFDKDTEGLALSYQRVYAAYSRVFKRCGLAYRVVEADAGAIGGSVNHEFMVLAQSGEAEIVFCSHCDYAANVERAESLSTSIPEEARGMGQVMELISTPGVRTVDEVALYLQISPSQIVKTLFYEADGEIIAVLLRGDHIINEVKLANILQCRDLRMAADDRVAQITGSPTGYVGPMHLREVRILADQEVARMGVAVIGANREGFHYRGVKPGIDFQWEAEHDLRLAQAGDACPRCQGQGNLESVRGIEVGHLFQLGTKYSSSLDATFTDENGQQRPFIMGCYGIGVSRTMAAAIEQNHDENGIIWPVSIAPYHVVVIPVSSKDSLQMDHATSLYQWLLEAGIEVVLDDRDERAGVKFMDADLIGYPIRITVGKKTLTNGTVDIRYRKTKDETALPVEDVVGVVRKFIRSS